MNKVAAKDFEAYYIYKAIFFSEDNIIVYPNRNTPFINFKDCLGVFQSKIKAVFLDETLLFVELGKQDEACELDIYPAQVFLRDGSEENMSYILRGVQALTWNHKCCYCSQCGSAINLVKNQVFEKKCKACDLSFFPNLSPAIMVL